MYFFEYHLPSRLYLIWFHFYYTHWEAELIGFLFYCPHAMFKCEIHGVSTNEALDFPVKKNNCYLGTFQEHLPAQRCSSIW